MSGPIEFSNGRDTVKIYTTTVRGKPLYQLALYRAGRHERRTFADRAEARRVAKLILTQLASGAKETEAVVTTPEVESLIAARKALDDIDCPDASSHHLRGDPKRRRKSGDRRFFSLLFCSSKLSLVIRNDSPILVCNRLEGGRDLLRPCNTFPKL